MKVRSLTPSRLILAAICATAVFTALSAPSARADQWTEQTVLTVKQPVQISDQLLEPGRYVMRIYNSPTFRYAVEIYNGDQTRIIDTVLVSPRYRLHSANTSEFTFWETPPGTARALRDWYYPGDVYGREFPYPKHPVVLTASLNAPPPSPAMEAPTPAPSAAMEKEPVTAPAPAPVAPAETPMPSQPTQMAEAAAPASPAPAPEPQPAGQDPATQESPSPPAPTMPHTASPYPAIGLAGLLMVGIYGLMRWRRAMYLR